MIKRQPKPKTIIPCVVLFVLSILVFCFMAAPMLALDMHDGRDNRTTYSYYEFFTIMNKDKVGGDDFVYDGKATISNIDYLDYQIKAINKQIAEVNTQDEVDKELLFELEFAKADTMLDIRNYKIALSLFVVNTLLLLVSLAGICVAAFNDAAGLGLKYASFGLLVVVFLIAIVASGFISSYNTELMQYAYFTGDTLTNHNVSAALIVSFALFGLLGAGAIEAAGFIQIKKEKKADSEVKEKATIIEDEIEDLPEDNAAPIEETVDHGVIDESEDTIDDVKPVK